MIRSGGTRLVVVLASALLLSTPIAAHATGSLPPSWSVSDTDSVSFEAARPGDGTVSGARIKPHTNRWKMSYVTAAETLATPNPSRVAEWYDTVTISSDGGSRVLHRRQTLAQRDGAIMETIDNWADAGTLAPRRTESHRSKGGVSVREFRGTRITGFEPDSAAPGVKRNVDTTIAMPAFDFFGGMYDVLIAALPLRAGYRVRIPTVFEPSPGAASLQWVTLSVLSREQIAIATPLGAVDAWHVETGSTPMGHFEFWIADATRNMVRMWYVGPRGGRQVWDVD
jgi:hypothetical protein